MAKRIVEYATREQAQQAVSTLSNQSLMGRLVYVREVGFHTSALFLDTWLENGLQSSNELFKIGSRGRATFHWTILTRRLRWCSSRRLWRLRSRRRRWCWWCWWCWWPSDLRLQRLFPSFTSPALLLSILTLDVLAPLQRWLAGPKGLVSPSR